MRAAAPERAAIAPITAREGPGLGFKRGIEAHGSTEKIII
jgi:hypothetical protein